MNAPTCPHCAAQQDPGSSGLCWFCRMPLDAPHAPGAVPAPPRPLPNAGSDSDITAAALAAGMVSVGAGGLLYSTGFGALMTLVVVMPLSWVLLSMFLSPSRAGPPASTRVLLVKAPSPPPQDEGPFAPVLMVLQALGAVLIVAVATALAAAIALGFACSYMLNAH